MRVERRASLPARCGVDRLAAALTNLHHDSVTPGKRECMGAPRSARSPIRVPLVRVPLVRVPGGTRGVTGPVHPP